MKILKPADQSVTNFFLDSLIKNKTYTFDQKCLYKCSVNFKKSICLRGKSHGFI